MKKTIRLLALLALGCCTCFFSCDEKQEMTYKDSLLNRTEKEQINFDVDSLKDFIIHQYTKSLKYVGTGNKIPRNSYKDGTIRTVGIESWVSGFYGGSLWYIYELTGDNTWLEPAKHWTEILEPIQHYEGIHDIGFMIYCSYGNGFRLTHNESYLPVLRQTSETLCKRFNPAVGTLLSWGNLADTLTQEYHNTIIDNLMNLELLMFSADKFNAPRFSGIARAHADKTAESHVRPDYSTFHVVEYDKMNGAIVKQKTHQGYEDSSDWARGQTWAIYGYNLMYKYTRESKYLDLACHIADRFIDRLPGDLVPYWDFDDPGIPDTYRDASAGAIASCALFDLSKLIDNADLELKYHNIAIGLLNNLTTKEYLATEEYYKCLLLHSVGHWNQKTEIDTNINYADYYYLEALLKALGIYHESSI
ncbi:MAG: glycoside hydrolase family 88 protein [Candidatus Azobacteroides sp.]|nr:glycoside hydrolase family 88 protein [Candidatus Azobacteroides sp.]